MISKKKVEESLDKSEIEMRSKKIDSDFLLPFQHSWKEMNTSTGSSKPKVVKKTAAPAPVVAAPAPTAEVPKKVAKKAVAPPPAPSASPAASRSGSPASRSSSPAPVAAPAPVAETPAVDSDHRTLADEVSAVRQELTRIRDACSAALVALKRVEKRAGQDVKEARKNRRKTREAEDGAPRKPSNFEKPVPISDELSAFFGGGKGATMRRAEVNKRMFAFASENKLSQGQTIHLASTPALLENGFNVTAAQRLRKLLAVPEGETLTIFNIQKYLGCHYPKATAPAPAS